MLPDPHEEPTVTIERAAEVLGISRASAYRAARDGTLPVLKFGRRLVVPTAQLMSLLGQPAGGRGPGSALRAVE